MVDFKKIDPELKMEYGELMLEIEILQNRATDIKMKIYQQLNSIKQEKKAEG